MEEAIVDRPQARATSGGHGGQGPSDSNGAHQVGRGIRNRVPRPPNPKETSIGERLLDLPGRGPGIQQERSGRDEAVGPDESDGIHVPSIGEHYPVTGSTPPPGYSEPAAVTGED